MDGTQNSLLRARWFAQDAEARFQRVLGDAEAESSPLTAQVRMSGAMADLYIGLAYCEAPGEPSGPAINSQALLRQAESKFTTAMSTASAAGTPEFQTAAQAGRAIARLMTGDYAGAAADAAAVPDGFSYDAIFNQQSTNSVVVLTTKNFNEAAGLMYKWWPQIDQSDNSGFFRDIFTDAPDQRMPVFFDGEVATDNETPHYSQWKYNKDTDDIPMVHSDHMRLIQAEAMMNAGDYAGATAILNDLRDAVGLAPLDVAADQATMQENLLSERLAELFMEGFRAVDLHRFGLTAQIFGELNDGERDATGRPTQFSMTDTEAVVNAQIDNDLAQRCLPVS